MDEIRTEVWSLYGEAAHHLTVESLLDSVDIRHHLLHDLKVFGAGSQRLAPLFEHVVTDFEHVVTDEALSTVTNTLNIRGEEDYLGMLTPDLLNTLDRMILDGQADTPVGAWLLRLAELDCLILNRPHTITLHQREDDPCT